MKIKILNSKAFIPKCGIISRKAGKIVSFAVLEIFLFTLTPAYSLIQPQAIDRAQEACLSPGINISSQSFQKGYESSFSYSANAGQNSREHLLPENQKKRQNILKQSISANFKPDNKFSTEDLEAIIIQSEKLYAKQQFASGEYHFNHVLEVADILSRWKVSPEFIIAAIIHRLSDSQIKELENKSGIKLKTSLRIMHVFLEIAEFPYAKINLKGGHDIQNVMDMIIQKTAGDSGLMQLVLADKLVSISTASEIEQEELIKEAEDIFGPLASRLGLRGVGNEFLNESFRLTRPEEYFAVLAEIKNRCGMDYEELKEYLPKKEEELKKALEEFKLKYGIKANITLTTRLKKPYEIATKIAVKGEDRLKDILGIRLIYNCSPAELETLQVFVTEHIGVWSLGQTSRLYMGDESKKELGGIYIKLNCDTSYDGEPYEVQLLTKVFHEWREREKPHWSYKLKQRTGQKFDTEDFSSVGEFRQDFQRVYNYVKNSLVVFFAVVGGGEIIAFKPKRLVRGATAADVAALRSVNRLDRGYEGAEIYHFVKGNLVNRAIGNSHTYELKAGDVVEIVKNGYGLEHRTRDLVELRRHAKQLRTQLMLSMIELKADREEKSRSLAGETSLKKEFGRFGIKGPWDFLYAYARNLGLENVKELFMALTYTSHIVSVSEVVESIKKMGKEVLSGDFNLDDMGDAFMLGQIAGGYNIDSLEKFYVWVGAGLISLDEIRKQKNKFKKSSVSQVPPATGKDFLFEIQIAREGEKQQIISRIIKRMENILIGAGFDSTSIRISRLGAGLTFIARGMDPLKAHELRNAIRAGKYITRVNYEELGSVKRELMVLEMELQGTADDSLASLMKQFFKLMGKIEDIEIVKINSDNIVLNEKGRPLLKVNVEIRTSFTERELRTKIKSINIISFALLEHSNSFVWFNSSEIDASI